MNDKKVVGRKAREGDPDNPEWTMGDFARARPASEIHGDLSASNLVRKRGRPPKPENERKKQVTLRLSQDVLSAARKTGPGWQARVDNVLRAAFSRGRGISMADLGAAIANSVRGDKLRTTLPMPRKAGRRAARDHQDNTKSA